ncbi:hypothetical protein ILYODFUR_014369 [Ilyodon furcidens]|uniref:THAP-type domain-containing protein n=1 Tax=Ilyodon furcidens TaxID=33524 RepID=A0ABV0V6J6_9TELE
MPRKKNWKLAWLVALRPKNPPTRVYVCSFHFINKKSTELQPDPELFLGSDQPPPKKRRRLIWTTVSQIASSTETQNLCLGVTGRCCCTAVAYQ